MKGFGNLFPKKANLAKKPVIKFVEGRLKY